MSMFAAPLAALALVMSTAPAAAEAEPPRTITISARGEVASTPDIATVSAAVVTQAKDAQTALAENAKKMTSVIKQVRAAGIEARDVQTTQVSLNAIYGRDERGRYSDKITGYEARNQVRARIRNLDKAGAILDALVASGANNIGNLSFGFADPAPLRDEARKDAVAEARRKAELYTDAAGVSLGRVMRITEGGDYSPQPMPAMRMMAAEADSTPIEAGESVIAASVTIVFEIK